MGSFVGSTPFLVGLIAFALSFDFLNRLHDMVFGLHVAATIGHGVIAAAIVDPLVIFGALAGTIAWNLLTWWLGIPSSSSHALVGATWLGRLATR